MQKCRKRPQCGKENSMPRMNSEPRIHGLIPRNHGETRTAEHIDGFAVFSWFFGPPISAQEQNPASLEGLHGIPLSEENSTQSVNVRTGMDGAPHLFSPTAPTKSHARFPPWPVSVGPTAFVLDAGGTEGLESLDGGKLTLLILPSRRKEKSISLWQKASNSEKQKKARLSWQ